MCIYYAQNKHTIPYNCFEPPDHSFRRVVFLVEKIREKKTMKKILLLIALGATCCRSGYGGYVCLASAYGECIGVTLDSDQRYSVDWAVECTTDEYVSSIGSSRHVRLRGVGMCSTVAATALGDTADSITVSRSSAGQYCWCKMLSPVVSKWVYMGDKGAAASCEQGCGSNCKTAMSGEAVAYRRVLIQSALTVQQ